MRNEQTPHVPGEAQLAPAPGQTEAISSGKRAMLKASWVVPVIAVMSLPKNSYAVVGSGV